MKKFVSYTGYFLQKNLLSLFVAAAVTLFVVAPTESFAGERSSKKQSVAVKQVEAKVNINRAGIPDLTTLIGVGEQKAIAIVKYRNANGKFKNITELTEVKGIGTKIVEKNRKRIVL